MGRLSKKKDDYVVFEATATKCEGRGRPSGRLITAFNKKVYQKVKIKTDNCIVTLLKVESTGRLICVCNCYARGKVNIGEYWKNFKSDLKILMTGYDCPLIITGDFNSRIGTLNSFKEAVQMNGPSQERTSLDKETNASGKELIEDLEEMELIVLIMEDLQRISLQISLILTKKVCQ